MHSHIFVTHLSTERRPPLLPYLGVIPTNEPRPLSIIKSTDLIRPNTTIIPHLPLWEEISHGYQMNRRSSPQEPLLIFVVKIRHGGRRLMGIIMTLDTCASSYRVPVKFPGEVGRERYRLELKCLQDGLHDLRSGSI